MPTPRLPTSGLPCSCQCQPGPQMVCLPCHPGAGSPACLHPVTPPLTPPSPHTLSSPCPPWHCRLTQLVPDSRGCRPREPVRREEAQRVDVEGDAHHGHGHLGPREQARQHHDHLSRESTRRSSTQHGVRRRCAGAPCATCSACPTCQMHRKCALKATKLSEGSQTGCQHPVPG